MAPPGKPKTTSTSSLFNISHTICAPVRLTFPSPLLDCISMNTLPSIPRSQGPNRKAAPLGGFFLFPGAHAGLSSPMPSQPPVAPAKQEHNNDDNKHRAGLEAPASADNAIPKRHSDGARIVRASGEQRGERVVSTISTAFHSLLTRRHACGLKKTKAALLGGSDLRSEAVTATCPIGYGSSPIIRVRSTLDRTITRLEDTAFIANIQFPESGQDCNLLSRFVKPSYSFV